jgi:hypothetical protein
LTIGATDGATGTAQRLTCTGEWYVPAGATLSEYTMILTWTPAFAAVEAAIAAGSDLSMQAGYNGVSWIAQGGGNAPCLQVGLSGTNGNASSAASDVNLSQLGSLATDTYYRLTGWVEWYGQQTNAGTTYPNNLYHFGWRLQTIDGPGGAVTGTVGDITWQALGYFQLGVLPPGVPGQVLDDMPPSAYINYREYRQPALSVSMEIGAGLFDAGYTENPATLTDGFAQAMLALDPLPTFWYRGAEKLGTTAWDSSGNGNNGTYAPGWTAMGFPTGYDIMGVPGAIPNVGAIANWENNDTNMFGIKSNQSLDTTAYTIMCAVNAANWSTNNPRLCATDHTDTTNNGMELGYSMQGTGLEYFQGNGSTYESVTDSTALDTGTWYLIFAVCTGTELALYVSGSLIGTTAISSPTAGSDDITFGYDPAYNGGAFTGALQDMAYWAGTALSATTISDLTTAWQSAQ